MTNTNSCETLSFNTSVELLKTIFPKDNWSRFLAKNILGLTDEFSAIPFKETEHGVWYLLDDLERFAVGFGQGTPSADVIAAIGDKFMGDLAEQTEGVLDAELDELLGALGDSSQERDSFMKARRDANGGILLSASEMATVFRAIDEIAGEQLETGYILTTLARVFNGLGYGDELSCTDITALSGVADAQATRLAKNGERIRSLFNALDTPLAQTAINPIKENIL